ncbi:NAC domain-containing protein 68 [Hordeum vulgare]|uniref:Predicted protein n=1 Tax=Hordeum vulgare subsp. vulgare TaxID=112509 RepID=F2E8A5_HORVV|nr:NAC domain-containing protein 68 [Hordeum vulgare]KAI4987985.1 hypothetical protein ZWY2020_029615 [Hordeum vulgare]BAK03577.1 predicted protein [Hordeum vulgare subsp. vulgare]
MGKAGRWLRSFLTGKKAKDKGTDDGLPAPAAKEKRRWSFRRPAASLSGRDTSAASGCHGKGQLASTSSHCFSEVNVVTVQDQHAAPHEVASTAPTAPPEDAARGAEEAAAVKIQSAFRSYLARKALCALRGMVKLQAIVRGQLVRRQADMTLRRIQALVAAQRRARAERLRLRLLDGGTPPARTSRRSPQHHYCSPRKPLSLAMQEAVNRGSEENGKGVGGMDSGARRSSCCSTPAKAELYYDRKASPGPSGMTSELSVRTFSGRFEEEHYSASFSAAGSEASARHRGKACHAHAASYMANTQSSRAKQARSQSAPRHRPEAASPSRSYERPASGSGGRRRASLDPRDLAGQVRAPSPRSSVDAGRVTPQDRPGAPLAGSECGSSSSTALLLASAAAARIAR